MTTTSIQSIINEIISNLPKFIKPMVMFLVLYLLMHKKTNDYKDRECKNRQILMSIVGVVYSVLGTVGGIIFFQKFDMARFWNKLCVTANALLSLSHINIRFPKFTGGEIIYVNVFIFLFYLIIRVPIKKTMMKRLDNQEKLDLYASEYYEYSNTYAAWFLKQEWRGFQRLFSTLAWVSVFVCPALLAFSWIYESKKSVVFVIFPFMLVIITEEISNALNGFTQAEYETRITGKDAVVASRIGGFQKIMPIYEKLFASPLLSSHPGTDYSRKQGPTDYLEELNASEIQSDQLAAHYFDQQKNDGVMLDVDYMHGTIKLLHRESVIFTNPFYRDLSKYILLPLVDSLIRGYKVLFLIGEKDIAEDVQEWITEMVIDYARVAGIWRAEYLDKEPSDCDIGILDFPSLYDIRVQNANKEFFQNVSLCVLVEAGNMVPTAQVALGVTVRELNRQEQKPIYCIIDRASDGLIDTFSHVLQTEITNVVAAPIPRCVYTAAAWDSDGDYQRQRLFEKETKFLGNGMELAAVAVKNQIPHVTWFGGRKAPVKDIEWISRQYFPLITEYTHMIKQQDSLRQKFSFEPNYWQAKQTEERFLIVEDQYCNLYEALRMFLSRGEQQSFVNVLSESYLLRDYMRYNKQMFMSDPKAVPSILPDYARTERNMTFQLILRMASGPVPQSEVVREMLLTNQDVSNPIKRMHDLIAKYTGITDAVITTERKSVDETSPTSTGENYYCIKEADYDAYFANTIKNAYYVVEDDRFNSEYIDAKVFGLITQMLLPGQFLTCNGKYYQVESINPGYGVLLRRASDRYDHRAYYRQIRHYKFENAGQYIPVSTRTEMDIEVAMERRDFKVETTGYLDMKAYHDLKTAKVVDFTKDASRNVLEREYHNKNVLRITLPRTDIRLRSTLAMLMQELFRTLYPENWYYLAVITDRPEGIEGMLNYMTYDSEMNYENEEDKIADSIYIIEDSFLDLGLLESINNNLMRIFEILTDYLNWHFEKIGESSDKDPLAREFVPKEEIEEAREKRSNSKERSKFMKALKGAAKEKEEADKEKEREKEREKRKKRKLFGRKKKDEEEQETVADSEGTQDPVISATGILSADENDTDAEKKEEIAATPVMEKITIPDYDAPVEGLGAEREPELLSDDLLESEVEDDLFAAEGMPEEIELLPGIMPIPVARYRKECYLKFGFDEIDERIDIENLKSYFTARGLSDNVLMRARTRKVHRFNLLDMEGEEECDFCGAILSGVSYEMLQDGRVRCNDCSATAVESVDEFRELFEQHLGLMMNYYSIRFNRPITVEVTDARTVAKGAQAVFKPSRGMDPRIVGYAQRRGEKFNLRLENGSPRLATIETLIHEMTHIWQYLNWDDRAFRSYYGKGKIAALLVYEGMAVWSAIQYLYLIGETSYAELQEALMELREDPYGIGFRMFRSVYPLDRAMNLPKSTPFSEGFPPIDRETFNDYKHYLISVIRGE